jgi:hypothetical protein
MLISYLISQSKNILNYFFYSLVITFILIESYAIIEYIFKLNSHPYRISSFFGDELILGSFLSRLLPLIIALYIIRKNKNNNQNFIFSIFLITTYFCIFISGERSAFFYVNMSLLFIFLFIKVNRKLLILSIIIISTLFIFVSSNQKNRFNSLIIDRYTKSLFGNIKMSFNFLKNINIKNDNLNLKNEHPNKSLNNNTKVIKEKNYTRVTKIDNIIFTSGHESLYRTALEMFYDRPIIGHGPKMFRKKCDKSEYSVIVNDASFGSCMTHPHNFYIQLLAETGIIGFIFLSSVFIYVCFLTIKYLYFRYFKQIQIYSNYNICILACILITAWPIIPNGNFFNNYLAILYSLPLGFFQRQNKI